MKITLGDATTTAPDLKKLDAYLKRKFARGIRVVSRLKKKDSAEVYVGEEYIGVLFFDEKDARHPISNCRSSRSISTSPVCSRDSAA